jgi:hypothetical protein
VFLTGCHQPLVLDQAQTTYKQLPTSGENFAAEATAVHKRHQALQGFILMEGHDTTFLITSAFSVDSGIRPKNVFRNLAPAELYEKVGAILSVVCKFVTPTWPASCSTALALPHPAALVSVLCSLHVLAAVWLSIAIISAHRCLLKPWIDLSRRAADPLS